MSADLTVSAARAMWHRPENDRLRAELRPLVQDLAQTVMDSIAATNEAEPIYGVALHPLTERSSTERDSYAYGLEADREALIEAGDLISVWNATLFDGYADAIRDPSPQEELVRRRLALEGIAAFNYWLLSEVAHHLNHTGAAPANATEDFVFFCMEHDLSDDFEMSFAYAVPAARYADLASRGLARPNHLATGSAWNHFDRPKPSR